MIISTLPLIAYRTDLLTHASQERITVISMIDLAQEDWEMINLEEGLWKSTLMVSDLHKASHCTKLAEEAMKKFLKRSGGIITEITSSWICYFISFWINPPDWTAGHKMPVQMLQWRDRILGRIGWMCTRCLWTSQHRSRTEATCEWRAPGRSKLGKLPEPPNTIASPAGEKWEVC